MIFRSWGVEKLEKHENRRYFGLLGGPESNFRVLGGSIPKRAVILDLGGDFSRPGVGVFLSFLGVGGENPGFRVRGPPFFAFF